MMETTVPYHPGFLLGRGVDARTMKPGFMLCEGEDSLSSTSIPEPEAKLISQFAYIKNLGDICDVLSIPPEYVLKVKAGYLENEIVKTCLKDLGSKDIFSFVFRTCFVQEKTVLPHDIHIAPQSSVVAHEDEDGGGMEKTTEALIAEAAADFESCHPSVKKDQHATHWVKAVEIGDEQIIVMKISSRERDKLDNLRKKIDDGLKARKSKLDDKKLKALRKTAQQIDKKLSKSHYSCASLDIHYGYFHELSKYPADMSGMVDTLEAFIDKCRGWKEMCAVDLTCDTENRTMMCNVGCHLKAKKAHGEVEDKDVDEETDSFVVVPPPQHFFTMRVTLKSFHKDIHRERVENPGSHTSYMYTDDSCQKYDVLERFRKFWDNCTAAVECFQDFLSSKKFLLENRTKNAKDVLQRIDSIYAKAHHAVKDLDFVHLPINTLEKMMDSNPLDTAKTFITMITSKLPPGSDLNLLMLGKTGHGKSATGNSILGQNAFHVEQCGESVTFESEVNYAKIDGRTIKVVDTPGMCDTNYSRDEDYTDHAVKVMSDAIVKCQQGLDALLLVISCKIRMTGEEAKSIELLKRILGESIIESHCIFVITYGDCFEGNFEDWCKNQSKYLGKLFKECNYRCVLFDNKTTDPAVKKEQLIQLITKVDKLRASSPLYTNEFFELAKQRQEKIIADERKPQLNEHIQREIQLLINSFFDFGQLQNKDELKERVSNLKNWAEENKVEDVTFNNIVSILFDIFCHDEDDARTENDSGEVGGAENDNVRADQGIALQVLYNDELMSQSRIVNARVTDEVGIEVKKRACFPGSSTVMVAGGKRINLDKLQVGDKVLVRDNTGALVFDTVYMFGHQDFDTSLDFKVLSTVSCDVFISRGHLVYCIKDKIELCIAAEKICVGDNILVATPDGLKAQPVVNITCQRKKGLFAPFTMSGTIVVDDALMSCYVDVLPATTAHRLLCPMRQLYQISPRTLTFVNGSTSEHPVPRWVNAALKFI